jgi:hypothetical protein
MNISPVAVVLFAVAFAVLLLPLLQALFVNLGNALTVVPIPKVKTEADLDKEYLKVISDWLFSVLTNPHGLVILVALSLIAYAAAEAVRPR